MSIVHVAAELTPIAKVGGLADVLSGLSQELVKQNHDVTIILPYYDCLNKELVENLHVEVEDFTSHFKGKAFSNTVWKGLVNRLPVYFIENHHPQKFFQRNCFYGAEDDLNRFLCFSRVVFDWLQRLEPKVVHLHDWQTAAIAPLFHNVEDRPGVVLTIHNMEYQGKCSPHDLTKIGLEADTVSKMGDNLVSGTSNLLKGGIVFSDFITTVSPSYAREVIATDKGCGLEKTLEECEQKFCGVLNGLDTAYWDPKNDPHIPRGGKVPCKKTLRERLGLCHDHKPLVGCVTRLVPQKGVHLIRHALFQTLERGGQFVLLGATTIPEIDADFKNLAKKFEEHPDIRIVLAQEEALAHLIFAASDLFVVPSLFEPCGLTQMIALRYGSIPVVRRTGGLADTVFDVDESKSGNGYTFEEPTEEEIEGALGRAIDCWFQDPEKWQKIVARGQEADYSWTPSAKQYVAIYDKVVDLASPLPRL